MRELKLKLCHLKVQCAKLQKKKKSVFTYFLWYVHADSVTQVCRDLSLRFLHHHCTRVEFQFLNKLTSNTSDKIQCFCYDKSNHVLFFYIPTSQVTMPQGALSSVVQCTEKL